MTTSHHNSSIGFDYILYMAFYKELFSFYNNQPLAESLFIIVLSVIEIPIILLTLFALCFLIKPCCTASLYVIHLILSDLIQIICILITTKAGLNEAKLLGAYYYSLIVSLYFMVCVAFERYLLVSYPRWYKSYHSLKLTCSISLFIWFVPLFFAKIYLPYLYFYYISLWVSFLIPYLIIIFCCMSTFRGLSHSISLTSRKRKLILGSLFLMLLTYTFLIFPFVILHIIHIYTSVSQGNLVFKKVHLFLFSLLSLKSLADCLLYFFMRADVDDATKSARCCRTDRHPNQTDINTTHN